MRELPCTKTRVPIVAPWPIKPFRQSAPASKARWYTVILGMLLLSMLISGCGKAPPDLVATPTGASTVTPSPTETPVPARPVIPYTPVAADMLSPIIVQRSPGRGEALLPDGDIELVFDKPMDQQAVGKAFRIERAGTAEMVEGTLTWANAQTVRFSPQTPLPRNTAFDVVLTQDAQATTGEPLGEPYFFRFSTAGDLQVAQVIPAPDAVDVETDATITVIFNRPVVPLTTLQEMENLPAPLSFEPVISGTGEWLNTSIYVFTPDAPLAGGIPYKATVAAGLQDTTGATLPADYVWEFGTVPPAVTWVTPSPDAVLVDINTPITVEFNQPVDATSARNAFSLRGDGLFGGEVRGTFAVQSQTLTFTPTQSLAFDTRYTVDIAEGVTSTAGGRGMDEPTTWQFTTVPLPEIVETRPEDGERDAPAHTDFMIVFNTPIDPTTVMPNISMTPPMSPTQVHTYYSQYDNTFVLRFGAQPSTDYSVTIDKGIADPYGNTLPRGRTVAFRTGPLPPNYHPRVPEFIATYDAGLPAQLIVAHLNLNRLTFRLYRMPTDVLTQSPWEWQDPDRVPDQTALIREWEMRLESPLNKQQNTVVPLTDTSDGLLDPGVYLLDIAAPDLDEGYRRNRRHLLVVSNLNLTMKSSPEEVFVWATDLATGEPVPNLALTMTEFYRETNHGTLTTDAQGIARMNLPRDHSEILVTSEDPFAAVASGWARGISPWDFGVSEGVSGQTFRAYIYTDRPLYRPTQTVHFKGVLRAENDALYSLPDIAQVHVRISSMYGEEVYNERLTVDELGTFEGSLELLEGAGLGQYSITAEFADQHSYTTFTVAAYRPPEFEVVVEADEDELRRGEGLNAVVTLSYYFGGPLKEAAVTWNLLAEPFTFEPPWGGTYTFRDTDDPYRCFDCWWWGEPVERTSLLSGQGTTDQNGQLTVTIDGQALTDALEKGAQRVTLEATATGPDHQEIAGRTSAIVHPGPYYIGLRPRAYVGRAGDENVTELVTVDWQGKRLAGQEIKVTFYRREWINTFIEDETGGGHWSWETEETLVDETVVTTDSRGEAAAPFVPEEGGSYHVVAEPAAPTPETAHIRSSIFVWVSGPDHVSWRRENHDRITLISDKATYEVGEIAEILIPSPFESPHWALVTVEREGVRRHELIRLENNSTIYRLPIVEEDIPNIYVSVVLIQARDAGGSDFKMGVLPLDVALAPRTLSVEIETDRDRAEPGETVNTTLTARDPSGQPVAGAVFSLDLVDKAVLNLQPRSQDILSSLYARRMLQVGTSSGLSVSANRYMEELAEDLDIANQMDAGLDSRSALVDAEEEMAEPAAAPLPTMGAMMDEAMGMGAMDGAALQGAALQEGIAVREEFADTAYWNATLVTNAAGQATATITLPDNLTTWVARAVGLTDQTVVGEGEAELVTTKPLLVRPVAPRFFVVDDRAQLAANVTNNTNETMQVDVGLTVDGVMISEETPARQTVTVPSNGETEVTWWVTVADVTQTELIFSATSGTYADASKPRLATGPDGTLLVLRYTAPDTVGTAGQITEGGARVEAIALPPEFDDRRGQLTVQLDPSLAAGMQEGLEYLEYYEYECTEQTVSRFLPNVLTYRALTALGIDDPELSARLPGLVEEGLSKLTSQQNPDGGWGWWHRGNNAQSNPYVSGYVVFALLKAQEAGFSVKQEVLDRGLAYLQSQIKSVREMRNTYDANRQAWLLYVLAEGKAADRNALDALYGNRDMLGTYARAYLAQAIWLQRSDDTRLATLLSDLNNAAILSATGAHWEESRPDWRAMNTDTRSTAIVLDTLAKLDPDSELIPNVVRWLMVARKVGIWETTQETAWALIALTNWMMETGELDAAYDFMLLLNDAEQARGTATPDTVRESVRTVIPITDLERDSTNALTIARTEGEGRLYYTAHLQVYLPVEQIEPADRGFVVYRRYTLASCEAEDRRECPEVREVKLGDVVRVDLTLITPHDRYYVVVEDPLPAGGEAVDTGLATTSLLAMDPHLQREGSRYWWWWNWYSRSEIHDEKVVLFADYLSAGTYEYSYTFRATLPGDYHVIPTTASEFYFPEVFGRSDGRLLTVGR